MPFVATLRPRHLAWLPAALLVAYLIAAASGMTVVPTSNAASSGVEVEAEVLPELHLEVTGCSSPGTGTASVTGGPAVWSASIVAADLTAADPDTELGDCDVTFGTNNVAGGARLMIRSARGAGDSFCTNALPDPCTGASGAFTDIGTPATANGEGRFGVSFAETDCSLAAGLVTAHRNALPATDTMVCETTAPSLSVDGDVNISFWANPALTQPAGTYLVGSELTVLEG